MSHYHITDRRTRGRITRAVVARGSRIIGCAILIDGRPWEGISGQAWADDRLRRHLRRCPAAEAAVRAAL